MESLGKYISETLTYVHTVKKFCDREPKWLLQREMELDMMRDIKDREERIDLKFTHVRNSEKKAKAFGEYLWSGLTQVTADTRLQELEKELGAVVKDTLEGLEKLDHFLDAVEKLAVTSLFVFTDNNSLCSLPSGMSAAGLRSVVSAARTASPLLIHFKRDAAVFFLPNLNNLEVLAFQLDKYMRISQQLCERMKERVTILCSGSIYGGKNGYPMLHISENMTEESMQKMLDHLNQLSNIRLDQHLRLTFLFQENALHFIGLFSHRRSRMRQFLSELEEIAVQLDKMKKGASISSVSGSSVGVAGGVLSIVGLALAPVTAGVSLVLTLTGVGLGVTSGVNSLVTGVTEMAVNGRCGKNANNIFQSYMEDVQKLLDCLEQVASRTGPIVGPDMVDVVLGAGRVINKVRGVGMGIDSLVDGVSAVKVLRSKEVAVSTTKMGLQEAKAARNVPNMAADLPDIGHLAKVTPLALSKSARSGFIALNALFIGLDVMFICKDSISLAKGSKSKISQVIYSRAVLWCSELDSWEKIHDSLCRGIWRFRKSQRILEQPFYPELES